MFIKIKTIKWYRLIYKFLGYVKSRKPTRDERILLIGMAEAGISIHDIARHFDIHKTNAYRTINLFWHKKVGWTPPEIGQTG